MKMWLDTRAPRGEIDCFIVVGDDELVVVSEAVLVQMELRVSHSHPAHALISSPPNDTAENTILRRTSSQFLIAPPGFQITNPLPHPLSLNAPRVYRAFKPQDRLNQVRLMNTSYRVIRVAQWLAKDCTNKRKTVPNATVSKFDDSSTSTSSEKYYLCGWNKNGIQRYHPTRPRIRRVRFDVFFSSNLIRSVHGRSTLTSQVSIHPTEFRNRPR